MSHKNFYAGAEIDRVTHLRGDATWLAARLNDPGSRVLPVWRARNFVTDEQEPASAAFSPVELGSLVENGISVTLLGLLGEIAYFALDVSHLEAPAEEPLLDARGFFQDLRAIGPLLAGPEGALLAYARAMTTWHRRHRFCSACGSSTLSVDAGHMRACTNADCDTRHFPRTDPAVIMLVEDGDRCLLGRQRVWPAGMHSTLAGFVEPGESLEEAVAREVFEETGVEVERPQYHSSQPWPFPSSIMLGFRAPARTTRIRIGDELENACWFSREELANSPEDDRLRLPRRDSIARRLIADWLADGQ